MIPFFQLTFIVKDLTWGQIQVLHKCTIQIWGCSHTCGFGQKLGLEFLLRYIVMAWYSE